MQKYDFIKKQYTPYTPPQNGHCDIMVHANEELNCAACGRTINEQHFQAYHDARWNGMGVLEARDLLIPQLKKIRLGWNGNFGISNSGLAYNSKLAYEILKTIRYATEKRDSSVLKVTNEPLPHVDGSFQIKAL